MHSARALAQKQGRFNTRRLRCSGGVVVVGARSTASAAVWTQTGGAETD
jgi:hypothetical protein